MKTSKIKPVIFLLLLGFAFISCSSDEDNDIPQDDVTQDLIIGKWLFSVSENDTATECEKTSYLEFFDDGTAIAILYKDAEGDCIPFIGNEYNFDLVSENSLKFIVLDSEGEEEIDNFFHTEIISVSATKMVLKDFAFIDGPTTFIKELD